MMSDCDAFAPITQALLGNQPTERTYILSGGWKSGSLLKVDVAPPNSIADVVDVLPQSRRYNHLHRHLLHYFVSNFISYLGSPFC